MLQFQQLYQALPKPCNEWTIDDVQRWLTLCGLNSLSAKFKYIDGNQLINLNQQQLMKQPFKISSRIFIKRIIQWIQIGRKRYNQYIELQQNGISKIDIQQKQQQVDEETKKCQYQIQQKLNLNQKSESYKQQKKNQIHHSKYPQIQPKDNTFKIQDSKFAESILQVQSHSNKQSTQAKLMKKSNFILMANSNFTNLNYLPSNQYPSKIQNIQHQSSKPLLIIKFVQLQEHKQYIVSDSVTIGRNINNYIKLNEDSVSRLHGRIIKSKKGQYYLMNEGKYGTYIQMKNKFQLAEKMHLLVGITQIYIQNISISNSTFQLKILIDEAKQPKQFTNRTHIVLGKKSKDIDLNDSQLANYHAKILMQDNKLIIQKLQSIVYRRLYQKQQYKLENDRFKMGNCILRAQKVFGCDYCGQRIWNELVCACQSNNLNKGIQKLK